MPNIHDIFKDECVNGVIIGGDYICAKLEYDGRQQGGQIYAKDRNEAMSVAVKMKTMLRDGLGDLFVEIYPDDSKWSLVYYG